MTFMLHPVFKKSARIRQAQCRTKQLKVTYHIPNGNTEFIQIVYGFELTTGSDQDFEINA